MTMTTTAFICTWCQTSAHPQSAMQPSFCTECVHATLQGRGETRKAPEPTPPAAHSGISDTSPSSLSTPCPLGCGRREPLYKKEIVYDRATRDYAMYLDQELVGFARTYHEAEVTLDQLVFELISGQYFTASCPADVAEWSYAPLDVADLLNLFQADPDAAYAKIAALTPEQRYAQSVAVAATTGKDAMAIEARWEAGIARRAPPPALLCDNCPALATITIDLLQLCEACERAAQARLRAAALGPVCLSCGDPVVQGGLCETCQEAGEPWPVAQEGDRSASGLIPVLALHTWATTDRPSFRAALAQLSAAQLEWQAAIYAAYLTMQTERTVTTEATLTHFKRSVAIHWSCATPTAKETTMNHTPGPWAYEPKARMKHDLSAPIKGPDGLYVATALDMNRYDRDEEVEANAHLIAAAPDLLAACEAAFDYWQATGFANCEPGCTCIVDLMRVAIAKARQDKAPV